ncbi:hypothetical protein CBR_g50174 [Chara braunii]|uniref:Uncharacterized protein n=1 Tax=Chara braunii TaxID=69332 RepID=A0A388M699_CHABU|nr:hypothetical protein CBR_g50174 [Chara braunii]|eukprot:GBG90081.1 hypothetical protein CBR_g50174 [Chara braunii]
MHDFCLTFPFAGILVMGGLVGFIKKGSSASLLGGVGSGGILFLASLISLSAYNNGTSSMAALVVETVVSAALSVVMGKRYMQTTKFMPAGLVASLSVVMTMFYAMKLMTGGNDIRQKLKK